ncbi:WXG100 family type VII secretion target [Carbonactinospora thermoautotrophica]|uniref:WXG100 family type VII secretion target n=1 Tax=Carbonactinospora thermoautotrophica TaxID=1469144 RepID=UPI002270C124|nr:hypothetical protein [Carbonactinospora thermoautotrophica]
MTGTFDLFEIVPDRLRQSGNGIESLSEQLGARLGNLRAQLEGAGPVWGGDEVGSAFGAAYREVAELAIEALGALTEAYQTTGANLKAMATAVEAADQAIADSLQQMMSRFRTNL